MTFFRRFAFHRFVKMHPPAQHVSPASHELVSAYKDILPAGLIELWRRKGLGFYGDLQIALIDPRSWQSVLDRWIVSLPDASRRIPIALTPFGVLVYYRKLAQANEDVAYIDPVSKKTGILALRLDDFFNKFLCERESVESLISPALAHSASEECKALAPGEVYEVDQMLLSMQMLRITKVNGLGMHHRLRDAVDPPKLKADMPTTVSDALPVEYRASFADIATGQGLCGLYLSSYSDWHRLLTLRPDGKYQLLFWRIHYQTFERTEIRGYSGTYKVSRNPEGDDTIELNIVLRVDSAGGDDNDAQLIMMCSDETIFLLRAHELEDIATAIGGSDQMGRGEYYFRRVALDDFFIDEPGDGRVAPPFWDLPKVLQALIHVEPLLATITHVDDLNSDDEYEGEGTVMCTLDLGEDDGLRMNMPLYSPENTGRQLKGWVWVMAPRACRAGINYRRGEDGAVEYGPMVGDVLTTRDPDR